MNLQTILKHSIREQLANCNCTKKLNPSESELDKLVQDVLFESKFLTEGANDPKNFQKIPAGSNNWRSAQPTAAQLASIIIEKGIKSVIRFNGDGTDTVDNFSINDEEAVSTQNGAKFYKLSSRKDQDTVNQLLNAGNVLIHCRHGADRTGGNIGGWLYSKGWGDTKKIWKYTTQYNGWNSMAINNPRSFSKGGYLFQATKFGVTDINHAQLLANNKDQVTFDDKSEPIVIDKNSPLEDKQLKLAKDCGWNTWQEYIDSGWDCIKLQYGSEGQPTTYMQHVLGIEDDGVFGPQTQACLQYFQKHVGIKETGKFDSMTFQNLRKILNKEITDYVSPEWCKTRKAWLEHAKSNGIDPNYKKPLTINTNDSNDQDVASIIRTLGLDLKAIDISGQSKYARKGEPLKSDKYFILHHTAGAGTAESTMRVLNSRKGGLGVQWIIDRDGILYQSLPLGSRGAHVLPSSDYVHKGAPRDDINNGTAQGVEICAKDDTDIQLIQCFTALKLVKSLGYNQSQIFGHGEANPGHRGRTEGITCKMFFARYWNSPIEKVYDALIKNGNKDILAQQMEQWPNFKIG